MYSTTKKTMPLIALLVHLDIFIKNYLSVKVMVDYYVCMYV